MGNNEQNKIDSDYTAVTLESGLEMQIKNNKTGRDFKNAQRIANDPSDLQFALVANLIKINGQIPVMEEVLDMQLEDVLELIGLVLGKKNSSELTT